MGFGMPDMPTYSYLYHSKYKCWNARYERRPIRPVQDKHVPKELKVLCLILGIQL